MYLPSSTTIAWSSTGCSTRVGELIEESTWRTSIFMFMRRSASSAPGLVLASTHLRHHRFISASWAIDGERSSSVSSNHSSVPKWSDPRSIVARHSSGEDAHGYSSDRLKEAPVAYRM